MRRSKKFVIGACVLVLSVLGCQTFTEVLTAPTRVIPEQVQSPTEVVLPTFAVSVPTNTAVATQTVVTPTEEAPPVPTATIETPEVADILPQDGVLLQDDFSDTSSGWKQEDSSAGVMDYFEGSYRIFVNQDKYLLWSTSGHTFSDVIIEVDARMIDGEDDNSIGVICRYQDINNFYAFLISSDGTFAIRKRVRGGDLEVISGSSYQASEFILQGFGENHIAVECSGSTLRLNINGNEVAEVIDGDIQSGDVGMIAGTFSAQTTDVLFDDFIVKATE